MIMMMLDIVLDKIKKEQALKNLMILRFWWIRMTNYQMILLTKSTKSLVPKFADSSFQQMFNLGISGNFDIEDYTWRLDKVQKFL